MCKESIAADTCPRCLRRMYYTEQHLLVCDAPKVKPATRRVPKLKVKEAVK